MNPHIIKNTIVITTDWLLEHGLCEGTACKVLRVNRDKKTYMVVGLADNKIYELDYRLVTRIARKHLGIKKVLLSLKNTGKLFEDYVPEKLCRIQRKYLEELGFIDENNEITVFGEMQINDQPFPKPPKQQYINLNMYKERYGENNINEETAKRIRKMYE